jgi:transcription elongation factor Elf1
MAPILKKKVGTMMEHYVANNFTCPSCNKKDLRVIGNHSPSLDIVCSCGKKIEVKSKCLSVNKLPTDISLPHGSYIDYVNRLKGGLDLFIVIYGVDRVKKIIKIREVLYATHTMLIEGTNIKVIKRDDNGLSNININDRTKLNNLSVPNSDRIIDFSGDVEDFKNRKNIT